jgi:predicted dienelactone hydrolase
VKILEIILFVWLIAGSFGFAFKHRPSKITFNILLSSAVLTLLLHALLEGIRWQLSLAYMYLIILFICLALRTYSKQNKIRKNLSSIIISLLSVIVIAVAALPGGYYFKPIQLDTPTGTYAIGKMSKHFVDESRDEPFTKSADDHREVIADIWYPSDTEVMDSNRAPFHSNIEQVTNEVAGVLGFPSFLLDNFHGIITHSALNVEVSNNQPSYPVIFYSHANFGFSSQNTSQFEELASYGYIVISLSHPYIGTGVVLEKGPITTLGDMTWPTDEEAQLVMETMSDDAIFVLNELERINDQDPDHILAGKMNLDQLGYFGHSYGGASAANALAKDTRFKAGINMDGYPFGRAPDIGIKQPFMYMLSTKLKTADEMSDHEFEAMDLDKETYERYMGEREHKQNSSIKGDGYMATIQGTSHFDFSEFGRWSPLGKTLGFSGSLEPSYLHKMINEVILAFFDKYLKGEANNLLNIKYPELRIEAK